MTTPRHRVGRYIVCHPDKLAPLLLHLELKCKTDNDADVGERFAKLHAAQNKDFEGQYQALVSYMDAGPSFADAAESWVVARLRDPVHTEYKAVEPNPVVAGVLANAFGAVDAQRMMMGLPEFISLLNRRADTRPSARPPHVIALVRRRVRNRSERRASERGRSERSEPERERARSPLRAPEEMRARRDRDMSAQLKELVGWLRADIAANAIDSSGTTVLDATDAEGLDAIQDETRSLGDRLASLEAWKAKSYFRSSAVQEWFDLPARDV